MADQTSLEQQAYSAVLPVLAQFVAEIGQDKSLGQYTREEILRLVEISVHEYQKFMLKLLSQGEYDEEVPF